MEDFEGHALVHITFVSLVVGVVRVGREQTEPMSKVTAVH